jgi:hypothetical protein
MTDHTEGLPELTPMTDEEVDGMFTYWRNEHGTTWADLIRRVEKVTFEKASAYGEACAKAAREDAASWEKQASDRVDDALRFAREADEWKAKALALLAELDRVRGERDAMLATLPGPIYMDPPDGGDVSPAEQMQRMAKDAARYRWLRAASNGEHMVVSGMLLEGEELDAAIDAARGKGKEGENG